MVATARPRRLHHNPVRAGFSLLEVILATGVLLGCLIVLSELAALGRRHTSDAEDLAAAQRICQTKMNEILAGLAPLESFDEAEVEDEPGWLYSVATEATSQPGLVAVRVTVYQDWFEAARPKQYVLVHWVRGSSDAATTESSSDKSSEASSLDEMLQEFVP